MEFKEKFIAFIDIIGFKYHVQSSERDGEPTLEKLLHVMKLLGTSEDVGAMESQRDQVCERSSRLTNNLDFQLTQVSDCAVISTEVSPAGVINLIFHCWKASVNLLANGYMCRGIITKGMIYHSSSQFMGSGYQDAAERERTVPAPFISIDPQVSEYVRSQDNAINELFDKCVTTDGSVAGVFPFHVLTTSFSIADVTHGREVNRRLRADIESFKQRVLSHIDGDNPAAVEKSEHYLRALNKRLDLCDRTDQILDSLSSAPAQQPGNMM